MAIGIQGKLNELRLCQRTDGTIQSEYNHANNKYQQSKTMYKSSKEEYKNAQQQLEIAKENFRNAPLSKMFKADKQVKLAKKNLKQKKQRYNTDKEQYKQHLRNLRRLRSEIRNQYNSHRDYARFFKRVQEAQKLVISLPKYITDEYTKQKSTYLSQKYSVDKSGKRTYLTPPNTICSNDTSTLIWEKRQEMLKTNIQKVAMQVKDTFKTTDGISDEER